LNTEACDGLIFNPRSPTACLKNGLETFDNGGGFGEYSNDKEETKAAIAGDKKA
jgi:hypothetical protein